MNQSNRLADFRERFIRCRDAYQSALKDFSDFHSQYHGTHHIPGGKDASVVWNITSDLIESQIDSSIPQPRVRPLRPTEKNRRLSRVVEDMLRNQLDRLPFEKLNDADERLCKIMGGSAFLVEWDNTVRCGEAVGDLSVRVIPAPQIIPQAGASDLREMDYLFLTLSDSRERLQKRYGVRIDGEVPEENDWLDGEENREDPLTQIICYYKNDKGGLGCFSWVGDTVLIDDPDFETRKETVCGFCGRVKSPGESRCPCGQSRWVKRSADSEEIFMEGGSIRAPYYYPRAFPLLIRQNVSQVGKLMGVSDCQVIRDFQLSINKVLSKANRKLLKAGSYVTKPRDLPFTFSDEDIAPVNIDNPAQLSMMKTLDLGVNIAQDFEVADKYYYIAKSMLGVTDSYQGKPDSTAQSGRAKEAQIAQASGRQKSKRTMKHAFYAELFERMFQFMLAYADEPRSFTSTDKAGEQVEQIFNRYDFLEQDSCGNWYYNDRFLFSVDESGIDENDKQLMLEDLRTDFRLGAYGNPAEPETLLAYWKEKDRRGYPGAGRQVTRLEDRAARIRP